MKKAFLLLTVLFFVVSTVFAQENSKQENSAKENPQKTSGWNFSVEPLFGMRIGKEGEIVWEKNSQNGDRYKLSELEWEYTPSFYLGGKVFSSYKRFEISFISKFFLPTNFGIIKDSDWQQDLWYKTGNTSIKTNYSESTNNIQKGQDLELVFTLKFYPTSFITLRPKLSLNYYHMNFYAISGTYWYGKGNNNSNKPYYSYNSENITSGNFIDSTVVEYDMKNLFFWAGVQIDFIPFKKVVFSLSTEAAIITYMYSSDNHILTKIQYKQYSVSAFYSVRQNASATFIFNKLISLSLNFSAVLTGETVGPSYSKNETQTSYNRNGYAGAYSKYLDFGISAKFSF